MGLVIGTYRQKIDGRIREDKAGADHGCPGGGGRRDVELAGRPLQGEPQQVGDVPGPGNDETHLEPHVLVDDGEDYADGEANQDLVPFPLDATE